MRILLQLYFLIWRFRAIRDDDVSDRGHHDHDGGDRDRDPHGDGHDDHDDDHGYRDDAHGHGGGDGGGGLHEYVRDHGHARHDGDDGRVNGHDRGDDEHASFPRDFI